MTSELRTEYRVGSVSDFPPGSHRVVEAGRRQIGVFNIAGALYALPNLCPHQTGPLCAAPRTTGTLEARAETDWKLEWVHEGEVIACPWHGLEFRVPTGQCLAHPEIRLRVYEVVVRDQSVVVRI